jgi:hypothetical protein
MMTRIMSYVTHNARAWLSRPGDALATRTSASKVGGERSGWNTAARGLRQPNSGRNSTSHEDGIAPFDPIMPPGDNDSCKLLIGNDLFGGEGGIRSTGSKALTSVTRTVTRIYGVSLKPPEPPKQHESRPLDPQIAPPIPSRHCGGCTPNRRIRATVRHLQRSLRRTRQFAVQ